MELTDAETRDIRKYLESLENEIKNPRKNRIENLFRMIRLKLNKAEKRNKGKRHGK